MHVLARANWARALMFHEALADELDGIIAAQVALAQLAGITGQAPRLPPCREVIVGIVSHAELEGIKPRRLWPSEPEGDAHMSSLKRIRARKKVRCAGMTQAFLMSTQDRLAQD